MPIQDPLNYLQTLLTKEYATEQYLHQKSREGKKETREPLVITISRDYGALGEVIAEKLSCYLGIPVYDQEILDRVAQRAKADKFYFKAHDEQSSAGLSTFLYSLVSGASATLQDYRRHLFEVVAEAAHKDCIIIGRGAHLILAGKKIFRVRVVGSKSICAQRIAEEFHIPFPEAEQKVHEINNKRHKSVIELYSQSIKHCSLEHATNFDLVINTDQIPVDGVTGVVLLAMREAGFFREVSPCRV